MTRPQWNHRYNNRATDRQRSSLLHPKIYSSTPKDEKANFRIQVSLRTWAIACATLALVALSWLLFVSPAFAIRRIDVVGSVTPDVLTEIQQLQGRNLLAYSSGSMTQSLRQAQSSIRELIVYKGLPDTLRIEVGLRTPVMRWKTGEDEYLLDAEGIPFRRGIGYTERSADDTAPLVVDLAKQPVVVGAKFMSPNFVALVQQLNREFPIRFPVGVDHYEIGDSTFSITLITDQGWKVQFDTLRAIDPQLIAFGEVFGKFHDGIKQYVDLRIEGRAYYKYGRLTPLIHRCTQMTQIQF